MNDVIVCVTVIKSDEGVLFHRTGSTYNDLDLKKKATIISITQSASGQKRVGVELVSTFIRRLLTITVK